MTQALQQASELACILPPVRIVAIDNKKDELDYIRKGFEAADIPCLSLLYDFSEGSISKNQNMNTSHVRFVFMDLNLGEIEGSDPAPLVGPLVDALKQLRIIGPYALIFWTKHEKMVEEVMPLLKQRTPQPFNLPFFFCTMSKSSLSLPREEDSTYSTKLDSLKNEITEIFTKKMIFSSIVSWENKVLESASNTLRVLHDTVRIPQDTGTAQNEEDFSKLLKHVAFSAWGEEAAKNNWGRSVASGLGPFLSDNLDYGISSDNIYSSIWTKSLSKDGESKLPKNVSVHILNTSCSLDAACKDTKAYGTWLEFSIKISNRRYKSAFGISGRSLIAEFINYNYEKESKMDFSEEVKLGLLDITRSCDYANRKHGLRRFALGALIPSKLNKYIKWDGRKQKHGAIYRLPEVALEVGEGPRQGSIIQVNFKYVLSLPDKSPLLTDSVVSPRFRVRKQILTDIIAKFGAHTTSPGFLRF